MKVASGNELLDPLQILRDELEIKSGDRVADLGCGGAGYFVIQAAKLVGNQGQVYGVDVLKDALTSLAGKVQLENLQNTKLLWSNVEKFGALKINDLSLDAVLLINVLYQNKDIETILKESLRLLKPEGRLLVIDWSPGRFPIGPEPGEKIDPTSVRNASATLGLKEIKAFEAGKYHFGIIFTKE